jgi:uncharacterized membrane protein
MAKEDTDMFSKFKIDKIPELIINKAKYKGGWYSKYIFDSICTAFKYDKSECASKAVIAKAEAESSGLDLWSIFLIVIFVSITMGVILYCYKRIVSRSLENMIDDAVKKQTMATIGQYSAFKDDSKVVVDERSRL